MFHKQIDHRPDLLGNIDLFYNAIQSTFDDFLNVDFPVLNKADWRPNVDIIENEDNVIIRADLPGVKQEDIDLQIEKNVLTLKGNRKNLEEKKGKTNFYLSERIFGFFERSFSLSSNIDASKAKATFKDGVLKLTLPFLKEPRKQKHISIEVK